MKKVFLIAGGAFTFLFASVLFHGFFFATFFDPMFGLVILVAWVIVGIVQARLWYKLGNANITVSIAPFDMEFDKKWEKVGADHDTTTD